MDYSDRMHPTVGGHSVSYINTQNVSPPPATDAGEPLVCTLSSEFPPAPAPVPAVVTLAPTFVSVGPVHANVFPNTATTSTTAAAPLPTPAFASASHYTPAVAAAGSGSGSALTLGAQPASADEVVEAEAASTHLGDVVTLLTDQHVQLRGLLNEIAATSGESRRLAFAHLQRLLALHETAEEVVVHPESRIVLADGDSVVAARLHEEQVTRVVMETLSTLDPDAPEFEATFDDFKKSIWKHMDAEERDEFPRLREALPPAQLAALKARVEVAERLAPPLFEGKQPTESDLLLGDQETRFNSLAATVRTGLEGGQ